MRPVRRTLSKYLAGWVARVLMLFSGTVYGAVHNMSDYMAYPIGVANTATPLVMLTLTKDHQLWQAAFNDYSDVDSDGINDTTYKNSIDYYGYFDTRRCYSYESGIWVAKGYTADHYCDTVDGDMSGNFMNWATMTRIDAIRKLFFGGYRSTDTTSQTILERAGLPADAHSFAKYYNGADLSRLTPWSNGSVPSVTIGSSRRDGITICNTTQGNPSDKSHLTTRAPLVRFVAGNYSLWSTNERWQCQWLGDFAQNPSSNVGGYGYNGNQPSLSGIQSYAISPRRSQGLAMPGNAGVVDYVVRIRACESHNGGQTDVTCKQYPSGVPKPTGLLQKYGEGDRIRFGLMTNSYAKNKSGGVLRKNTGTIDNEIDLDNGVFHVAPSDGSIINTLNRFKIYGYNYGAYTSEGDAFDGMSGTYRGDVGDQCDWLMVDLPEGRCKSWGNPLSEMILEAVRYLASDSSGPQFAADDTTGINWPEGPRVASSWQKPVDSNNACAAMSVVTVNGNVASYDADQMSGLSGFNAETWTDKVGDATREKINGNAFFIGSNGSSNNEFCDAKTLAGFSDAKGLCPEAPTLQGSYLSSGVALYSHTQDLRTDLPGRQVINFFGIDFANSMPSVEIPLPSNPSRKVRLMPAYRNLNKPTDPGGGQLVTFKIVEQDVAAGTGKLFVSWEDSEQGGDFDQDQWGTLSYAISGNNISVTTDVVYSSSTPPQLFGYVISGTDNDGFHAHSGSHNADWTDNADWTLAGANVCGNEATTYPSMQLRVSTSGWAGTSMQKISAGVWATTLSLPANAQVKFDVNGDWATNWGDNESDRYADAGGSNITPSEGAGTYRVVFTEETLLYSIRRIYQDNPAMQVRVSTDSPAWAAGLHPMTLWSNKLWDATLDLTSSSQFKFDAAGDWNRNWGDNSSDGVADLYGNNISVGLGSGKYRITFNEENSKYTVNRYGASTSGRGCVDCNACDGPTRATYRITGTAAQQLKSPLYYVAKWGGYSYIDPNAAVPSLAWDKYNNASGVAGADGVPDNYFALTNPAQLANRLDSVFSAIATGRFAAGQASIITANANGTGAVFQASYETLRQNGTDTVTWIGNVTGLWIDEYGFIREDGDRNAALGNYNDDPVVTFANSGGASVFYRKQSTDANTFSDSGSVSGPFPVEQLNTIWDARSGLARLNNVSNQRAYGTASTNGRYITTWIDANGDGVVQNSEYGGFTESRFTNTNYAYLNVDDLSTARGVVRYVRGDEADDMRNRTIDLGDGVRRVARLGDIVHSVPTPVGRPLENYDIIYGDEGYANFVRKYRNRRQVVYVGANDGMLHAFNSGFYDESSRSFKTQPPGSTAEAAHALGAELWSYVPYNLLPHLKWLTDPTYSHVYYVDGAPRVFDAQIFANDTDHPNGWGTVLVVGMRLGGGLLSLHVDADDDEPDQRTFRSAYIVFDITNPEKAPKLLAEVTAPELGFTTSRPALLHVSDGSTNDIWQLIFGSGANGAEFAQFGVLNTGNSERSATIFRWDLKARPALPTKVVLAEPNGVVGDPVVVDWDLNRRADQVYFGVGSGNNADGALYRWSTGESLTPSAWSAPSKVLAAGRPLLQRPTVGVDEIGQRWIYAGTGRFTVPSDARISAQEFLVGVRDTDAATIAMSSLLDITSVVVKGTGAVSGLTESVTNFTQLESTASSGAGWKLRLAYDGSSPSERVLEPIPLLGKYLFPTSYQPSTNLCKDDGVTSLRGLYYRTGTAHAKNEVFPDPPTDTTPGETGTPSSGTVETTKTFLGRLYGAAIMVPREVPSTGPMAATPCGQGKDAIQLISNSSLGGLEQRSGCVFGTLNSGETSWREQTE